MAFYEVYREDATGYASAVVRAHGTRQAIGALSHLGYTQKNATAERIPDGRALPVKILAVDEEPLTPVTPDNLAEILG